MKGKTDIFRPISILTVAVLVMGIGRSAGPAFAADRDDAMVVAGAKSEDPLIDQSFEESMLKHFEKRFFNRIDATDTQRGKLSSILENRLTATRPMREKLRQEVLVLTDLMDKDDATDAQISQQVAVVKGIRDQLADGRLTTALKVRAELTPAQRHQVSDRIRGFVSGDFKPHRMIGSLMPGRRVVGQLIPDQLNFGK
jgi:Spy/CpxP family protein refolding chaperone